MSKLPKDNINKKEAEELKRALERFKVILRFSNIVLNTKNGKRMFNVVTKTWNPITGCTHLCRYCWAYKFVEMRLRKTSPKYRNGFKPALHEEEFNVKFNGGFVFVVDMGDMFCNGIPDRWIRKILNYIKKFPNTLFLLLTKNPIRYMDFLNEFPENVILGSTIETNRDNLYVKERISSAPLPSIRYKAMKEISWPMKFISIEPILDFDLEIFVKWIKDIEPFLIYVGYDNYNNRLPEPPVNKTLRLISILSEYALIIKRTIRPAWYERESITRYFYF